MPRPRPDPPRRPPRLWILLAPAASTSVQLELPADAQSLPSAAALAAEGVALPALRLELHAFNTEPRNRFVYINGRKYVEGERLVEGPSLASITPTGAVLTHSGEGGFSWFRSELIQEKAALPRFSVFWARPKCRRHSSDR